MLKAENNLHSFIHSYRIAGLPEAARTFLTASSHLPFQLGLQHFDHATIGSSDLHGIPHVTRVLFWCHVLTGTKLAPQILGNRFSDPSLPHDALLAALLHDLCRRSHAEDISHGEEASRKYAALIKQACGGDAVRAVRISEAVTYHCRDDYRNRNNPVYCILKDADALDRGRFAPPCSGHDFKGKYCSSPQCYHDGCAYNTLRLNYDSVQSSNVDFPFRKDMAIAARNLAAATETICWDYEDPIRFFASWLLKSQQAWLSSVENEY